MDLGRMCPLAFVLKLTPTTPCSALTVLKCPWRFQVCQSISTSPQFLPVSRLCHSHFAGEETLGERGKTWPRQVWSGRTKRFAKLYKLKELPWGYSRDVLVKASRISRSMDLAQRLAPDMASPSPTPTWDKCQALDSAVCLPPLVLQSIGRQLQ